MIEFVWIVAAAAYFLAGLIKGTLGIGFPTAAIALMTFVVDARLAIALVVIPMTLVNAWQIIRSGGVMSVWHRNWPLIVCMGGAIGAASLISGEVPIRWLTLALGIITALFALLSLWRQPPKLSERHDRPAQVVTGLVAGVMGGIAGIWAPPILVYLTSRQVDRDEFVQTVGVLLFIGSAILLSGYIKVGIVNADNALMSSLLVLPTILGFAVGERMRGLLPVSVFQKLVLVFFFIMGLNLIRRSFLM